MTESHTHRYLVGLTGGIGSGKTAAANCFADLDITIVDADVASRTVVEPGKPALDQIAEHFGADILNSDGTLDRTALRHLIFADDTKRKWLQSLLHPLISKQLQVEIEQAQSPYVVLVNPLLFESGQHQWCHRVLTIDLPEHLQLSRTMARDNNNQQQVENIMRAQLGREKRLSMTDDCILNEGSLSDLNQAVIKQHTKYLELCQTHQES